MIHLQVETIDLAMQVENIFPCIPKLFRLVGLKGKGISYDTKSRRWFITVPNTDQRQQTMKSNEISIDKRVQNLEEVLVQMSAVLNLQSEQLAKILDMVDKRRKERTEDTSVTFKLVNHDFTFITLLLYCLTGPLVEWLLYAFYS